MTKTLLSFSILVVLWLPVLVLAVAGPTEGENGGPCLPDNRCNDTYAICTEGICNCAESYIDVAGLCRRQDGSLGADCQIISDCLDVNSVCSSNTCQCRPGFEPDNTDLGSLCIQSTETPAPCLLQCANGGSCVVNPTDGTQSCQCPQEFTGSTCQFENLCLSNPCPAGSECIVNDLGERQCNCPPDVADCLTVPTTLSTTREPTTTPWESTPPTSTVPTVCSLNCMHGGTCIIDQANGDRCECLRGFTGQLCEVNIDYCINNSCPAGATCLSDASTSLGYVCICAGDFKGPNCNEADPLVTCRDTNKTLYLERQPSATERTICLPKGGGFSNAPCSDETESLIFSALGIDDTLIRIADTLEDYCIEYYADHTLAATYCITLMAYEADDKINRPWRNANATLCFVFNKQPEFYHQPERRYNLPEMRATEILTLSASDRDLHQVLTFSIEVSPANYSSLFTLSSTNGPDVQLQITKPGQIPTDPLDVDVLVTVVDNGIPALMVERVVKVIFTNRELFCSINESTIYVQDEATILPKELGRITCQPENPNVIFSLQEDDDLSAFFSVDSTTGALFLSQQLQTGDYNLNIQADILNPVALSTQVPVVVKIGNWLPNCPLDFQAFTMSENAPIGACSDTIYTCSNPSGKPVTCTDIQFDLFRIECLPDQFNVVRFKFCSESSLKHMIGSYPVNVSLENVFGGSYVGVEALVGNENDRPELTKDTEYLFHVPEDFAVGGIIGNITVTDPDLQVQISPPELLVAEILPPSSLVDSQLALPFTASLSSDQDFVTILLNSPLDADVSRRYDFILKVTDRGGLSDSVPVIIIVDDVNERPFCDRYSYQVSLSVKDEIGKVVASLLCTDNDVETAFKTIIYEIQGNQVVTDHFAVNRSGVVTLRRPLYNVTDPMLNVTVKVTDERGLVTTLPVTIMVSIGRDFPPECNKSAITSSKSEDTQEDVCFTVDTGCTEPVNSFPLTYEITSGNGIRLFRLDNTASPGSNVGLCTSASLKNEYGTWQLNGMAISAFGRTPITITISVTDKNDPPQFSNEAYNTLIPENHPVGSIILTVRATDPDSGEFGRVVYISEGIENSTFFSLNSDTGAISVKGPIDADSNRPVEYTYIVKAVDGGPQHDPVVTAQVTIRIVDLNDNAPTCEKPSTSVPLYLLIPPKTIVYTLHCSDQDRSPEFKQLRYSLVSQSIDGMFTIDEATGVIRLESALTRDTPEYAVTVQVTDSDDPEANSVDVNLRFIVNNTVPATCTPGIVTETIPETKPINFCLHQVECVDVTGGSSINLTSVTGNGTKFLNIRERLQDGNMLFLSACIMNSVKDQFGTYQIEGIVDNGLAETIVVWTFTITNVNEPPRFDPPSYNMSIPENFKPDSVLKVSVADPDDNTPDTTFRIARVTAKLLNDAEYNGALSESIRFFNSSREFFVVVNDLNATIRNGYLFEVTAEDGMGLKATATVKINITDVNEVPFCEDSSVSFSTDILADVGSTIGQVLCFDSDIDPNNKRLNYSIENGDPDGYFATTPNGAIRIDKKLPRLRLYKTGQALLTVQVQDNGTPPLSTIVTATVTVDNNIAPVCNPVIQPPDIWVQGQCMTVIMGCSDPTLPESTNHLAYKVAGNYSQTNAFTTSIVLGAEFDMCYTRTTSGFYEIRLTVDNGLSMYSSKKVVEVRYEEATPVFTESTFKKTVSEFTGADEEIITASAISQNLIGVLSYTVIDAESSSGWSDYFYLNSSTGKITTRKALKNLANNLMRLAVEVEDTGAKLKSSALVEITIRDENEPPVCNIMVSEVTVDVDAGVDHPVLEFTCSDPDVVPEYKRLSYALTGSTNVNIYFKLTLDREPNTISLKSRLSVNRNSYDNRVDVSRSSYFVQLQVSDSGDPPKVYKKLITVIVSLLPPPLEWEVLELGFSHVFISWKYNRADYNQITNTTQVKVQEPDSNQFYPTEVLSSDRRFYNTTGLKDNTVYEIFLSAMTWYGTRNTPSSQIKTLEIPKITKLTAILKIVDREYTSALRNPSSTEFKDASKRITDGIAFSLRDSPGYVRSEAIRYRSGSILVEVDIFVNQTGNVEDTQTSLAQSITSGYLGDVAVDSTYFISTIDGGYVNVDSIKLGNDSVYNGTDMEILCSVTTAGYDVDPQFQFWWTFNENIIRPNSASRLSVISYPETAFPELYMSILQVKKVSPRDSGRYECYVTDSAQRSSNKHIDVKVLSQPVVSLQPRSLTVDSGSEITVVCTVVEPMGSSTDFQFLWFRNGSQLQTKEGEEYSSNTTTSILQISSMTVTTIFGCRGRNDAGEGPLVTSHIGVKPQVLLRSCPETEAYDISWPETLPEMVAIIPCPAGYSGEISRQCGENGEFLLPRDTCVKDSIIAINQQVKDIKDGSGTTTVTEAMKGLSNITEGKIKYGGDLRAVVNTLEETTSASNVTSDDLDAGQEQEEIESYLKVCSNLIDKKHKTTWDNTIANDGYGGNEVSNVVEKYVMLKAEQLSAKINGSFQRIFDQKNIFAVIGKEEDKSVTFPDRMASNTLPGWVKNSSTGVFMSQKTFQDLPAVLFDCQYYRDLSKIVVKKRKQGRNSAEDVSQQLDFNSEIVGFNVQGKTTNLDPPVEIRFKLYDTNYSNPECVFWDRDEQTWSTEGCFVAETSEDMVMCKCSHLTNFAILMSPGKTPPADVLALSIISAVGCAISMFCLLVTLIVHLSLWRVVKSDRAIVLLNLCVALLIALALFLGGVGRAENKDLCTAISILLHYIFLVVFFLMLAEGIDIAVTIMYVFATKSRIKWLIPLSWLIPAVIVAISAGVTRLEGYGNDTFCWLSTESGLLWAFVGPAAFIILVNFIIIVIVFRQMFSSSAMVTKSDKEKAKTSLRSLCVLLPIMGITWVFGVFSVNESLVAFQYIFAIFNSLQGFFIFLFHCFFNKQLRDAIKQRRARKKSLQSFEKSFKNQHSTGTGSTADQMTESKNKDYNTEPGSKSSTSNPFLEADRQMKELVDKSKKTGNTFDKDANNKKLSKDKPPVDVALEDVKISNILRESEVMSGTAGISSIFTTQPDAEPKDSKTERPTEDKNKFRESKTSSHTYEYAVDPSFSYSGGLQKPAGYEKLLPHAQPSSSAGYDRIVRSEDNVSSGVYGERDSGSHGRSVPGLRERMHERRDMSTGSTRSEDDYEVHVSQEIGESLPKKYEIKQSKKPEPVKKGKPIAKETGAVKKLSNKKKKEMEKDRSRLYQYQYPYESTYLGQPSSRHASLENMSGYYVNPGYNPYAGMHPQGQTGRPTHQHQQWNPTGWGHQQRRDYW